MSTSPSQGKHLYGELYRGGTAIGSGGRDSDDYRYDGSDNDDIE